MYLGDSDGSESSFLSDSALAAAMATVIRAPHKDFVVVKQEWAALRIQAAFRDFLVICLTWDTKLLTFLLYLVQLINPCRRLVDS